jgi:hypothetical protein
MGYRVSCFFFFLLFSYTMAFKAGKGYMQAAGQAIHETRVIEGEDIRFKQGKAQRTGRNTDTFKFIESSFSEHVASNVCPLYLVFYVTVYCSTVLS